MFKNLGKALNIIKVLVAIIPLLRPLIAQVEVPGFGPDKKAAVLGALSGTIELLPWNIGAEVKEAVLKIVSALIDLILGILNLVGHDWKKTTE